MVEALKAGFQGFFDNSLDVPDAGAGRLAVPRPGAARHHDPHRDLARARSSGSSSQVLGLTTDFLWRKLDEHIGQDQVETIRDGMTTLGGAWAFIKDVSDRGIVAIWEYVVDQLSTLWDTILSMASRMDHEGDHRQGTAKLLSMLDPTGIMAVVNGCIAFFEAVQSAIEYLTDILQIVDMYVSTFASIAKGDIGPGAQMIEQGLAAPCRSPSASWPTRSASANVPEKIAEIIRSMREIVEAAIDWLIEQAM